MLDPRSAWWFPRVTQRLDARWTGKLVLNVKDGKVIEVEYTEREREARS